MKKWMTCLTIFIILLILALGIIGYLVEVYIPRMAEESIANLLKQKLDLKEPPEVKLKFGALELLQGKVREVDIFFPDLVFNGVDSRKVKVKISRIYLNTSKLIEERKLELSEPFDVWLSFYLPEEETKNLLHNPDSMVIPYDWEVRLKKDRILIEAEVEPVEGTVIPAVLVGRLETDGEAVRFIPVEVREVDPLMASLIKLVVFPELEKKVRLQNLPLGVKILKVKILPGELFVVAEAKDVTLPEEMMNE